MAPTTDTMLTQALSDTYLIHSSAPGGISFVSTCDIECATCPDDNSSLCLTCYQSTSISVYIYFYNNWCYEQCPTHTYYN